MSIGLTTGGAEVMGHEPLAVRRSRAVSPVKVPCCSGAFCCSRPAVPALSEDSGPSNRPLRAGALKARCKPAVTALECSILNPGIRLGQSLIVMI